MIRFLLLITLFFFVADLVGQANYNQRINLAKSNKGYSDKAKALLPIVDELKQTEFDDTLANAAYLFALYNNVSKVFPERQVEVSEIALDAYSKLDIEGYRIVRLLWYAASQYYIDGDVSLAIERINAMDEYIIEDERDMGALVRGKILASQIFRERGDEGVGINLMEYIINHSKFRENYSKNVKHGCFMELSVCKAKSTVADGTEVLEYLDSASVYAQNHYEKGQVLFQKATCHKTKNDFEQSYEWNKNAFYHYSDQTDKRSIEELLGVTVNGIDDLIKTDNQNDELLVGFADKFLDTVSTFHDNIIPLMTNRLSYASAIGDVERCNDLISLYSNLALKFSFGKRKQFHYLADWNVEVAKFYHKLEKINSENGHLDSAFYYIKKADDFAVQYDKDIKTKEGVLASRSIIKEVYEVGIDIAASRNDHEWFFYFSEKTKNTILLYESISRKPSNKREYELLSSLQTFENKSDSLMDELRELRRDKVKEINIDEERMIIEPIGFNNFVNDYKSKIVFNYSFGSEKLFLQVINKDQSSIYVLGDKIDVNKLIDDYHMDENSDINGLIDLPSEVRNLINETGKSLLLIPDGLIFKMPFEILHGLEKEVRQVVYSHSASISAIMQGRNPIVSNALLISPDYSSKSSAEGVVEKGENFGSLPYSRIETNKIADHLGFGNVLDGLVDVGRFMSQYRNANLLHYSGHSIAVDDANLSYLPLGNSKSLRLYGYQIQQERSQANLVVLNACNTGSGTSIVGEGIQSLTNSFILSGVSSLVATLWSIDDRSSSEILLNFYHNLKMGLPKSKALADAKNTFLQTCPDYQRHPYYWAGIVLSGDDASLEFSNPKKWYENRIIIGCISLLLLGFMYYRCKGFLVAS